MKKLNETKKERRRRVREIRENGKLNKYKVDKRKIERVEQLITSLKSA